MEFHGEFWRYLKSFLEFLGGLRVSGVLWRFFWIFGEFWGVLESFGEFWRFLESFREFSQAF